jgi:hypothetical protein
MSTWLPGQEGDGAGQVDGEAALHAAEDHALDARGAGELGLELVPGGFAAGTVARQHRLAMHVLDAVDIDLDGVADLQIGLLAGRCELAEPDAAFGLQADVDDGHVVLDTGDGALDDAAFEAFVLAAERFIEERREILAGRVCRSGHKVMFPVSRFRPSGCIRRSWVADLPQRPHADATPAGRSLGQMRGRRSVALTTRRRAEHPAEAGP